MARGRRRPSRDRARAAMLDTMAGFVYDANAPINLALPGMEEAIQSSGVSRSAAYDVWPTREDLFDSVVAHLITNNLYDVPNIVEAQEKIVAQTEKAELSRNAAVLTMGAVVVKATNHVVAARVEAVALHRMNDPEVHEPLRSLLADTQRGYIAALAQGYEDLHASTGEDLITGRNYKEYGATVATAARGIALNPFNLRGEPQEAQDQRFLQIADQFVL